MQRLVGFVRTARFQAFACLAIGFAGLLIYAYPGFMSSDSAAQFVDARSHQYTDWHPAAMAAVWTVLDKIVAGPALMLVLQGSLFLIGTYRLLRALLSERAAAIAASAILLFPPVLAPMAVIWKDSQMASFLLMAASLLIDKRMSLRIVGIALLAVATAYRDNAAAATLPLLLVLFRTPRFTQRWNAIAIAVAIWVGTVGAALTTNKLLTKVQLHSWYVSLGPSDIIGILEQARPHSDGELLQILDGTPLVKRDHIQQHAQTYYNPWSWWNYMSGPRRMFDWPTTPEQRAAVARAWKTMVFGNPRAYFLHRLRVFRGVIAIDGRPIYDPVWKTHLDVEHLDSPNASSEASGVQGAIAGALTWVATSTPLFRPYLYLLLAFVLVVVARRQRIAIALLASGIAYELALFFIAPSPDFRYSHWMLSSTLIAAVLAVADRIRSARRPGAARTDA